MEREGSFSRGQKAASPTTTCSTHNQQSITTGGSPPLELQPALQCPHSSAALLLSPQLARCLTCGRSSHSRVLLRRRLPRVHPLPGALAPQASSHPCALREVQEALPPLPIRCGCAVVLREGYSVSVASNSSISELPMADSQARLSPSKVRSFASRATALLSPLTCLC